jgi:acyl CoA:acetate/3-ketoacid CoA transferase
MKRDKFVTADEAASLIGDGATVGRVGGGLDIAFPGFGQFDEAGNVNLSKLGGLPLGPGGLIDVAQNARKVVF